MARAFLLHLLGAYLFANGGQMVSLRWLTLFQDFGKAQRPTKDRHVLPIFTLPSTLSAGEPYNSLWGLGSSLKLVLFPFLAFSLVTCSLANCIILRTVILHLTYGSCFFCSSRLLGMTS